MLVHEKETLNVHDTKIEHHKSYEHEIKFLKALSAARANMHDLRL